MPFASPTRPAGFLLPFSLPGLCLLLLGAALLLAPSLPAQGAPSRAAAGQPDPQEAVELVRRTADRVLQILRQRREELRAHPERLYELVRAEVLPHFDFHTIARWVLGKHWRRATPEQRRRFEEEFRQLLVRTYARSLLDYTEARLELLPPRRGRRPGRVIVRSRILPPGGGEPVPVDYLMRFGPDGWKVVDVRIGGVSLVANYRASFAAQIAARGLDRLLAELAERNRKGLAAPPGGRSGGEGPRGG